jgi:transcriptional regulator with XRE-family HTH domain
MLPVWRYTANRQATANLTHGRHAGMSDFGTELARLMAARGLGVRELARMVPCNPGHVSNLRSGKARPSPELAADLDERLGAGGSLAAEDRCVISAADDEIAALELARRAEASDVGNGTCEWLELAVDDLATAYPRSAPGDLLPRARTLLAYTTRLLDGRTTLGQRQRQRLMVSGGWLSLLAATLLIDQHQDDAASAYLRTAMQLARETGHTEIAAWCAETRAWQLLTSGGYRQAVKLSRAAQEVASSGGSAHIQATAQEGRAWARLGDSRQTRAALAAVERLVSPLPPPERPEHHYVYDPPKARVYVATTLAWLGDNAAEPAARDILAALENHGADPPRPRRIALARLDLALALATAGKLDESAASASAAVASGRLAPVDRPRVHEIVAVVTGRAAPGAAELAEAYRSEFSGG